MKEKIKLSWLKIRLFFNELFTYKLPALWEWFKDKFHNDPLMTSFTTIVIFIGIPMGIYEGIQYSKVRQAEFQAEKAQEKYQKEQGIMNIVQAGPEKFLEQQLSTNYTGVQALFNNSVKWHGKYQEVINHTKDFRQNSQYQDYLNPIIQDLQSGQTISSQKTGIKFSSKQIDITTNSGVLGVMIVYINPDNYNDVKHALEYQHEDHNYELEIYNSKTQSGYSLFDWARQQYLFGGDGERKGFNSSNDWTGKIYAFNNSRWVYRSKTLPNKLPAKLPQTSLNHEDEINTTKLIKQQQLAGVTNDSSSSDNSSNNSSSNNSSN